MLDSQGKQKRKLHARYYFAAAIIALLIDYAILHSGSHLAGFDIPENELYFISKFIVILAAIFIFHRIRNAILSVLATGFLGSAMFSVYYALVRPDIFGLADSAGYSDYESAVTYSLEQAIIIYLVHAVGIAVGYAAMLVVAKMQKK